MPAAVRPTRPARADIAERVVGRDRIDVENHLFRSGRTAVVERAAAMDGVLPAVLVAAVIEICPLAVRHRHVGLPNTPLDLLEQLLLRGGGVRQRFPQPGVFRLQVGAHRGVVPVAQQ